MHGDRSSPMPRRAAIGVNCGGSAQAVRPRAAARGRPEFLPRGTHASVPSMLLLPALAIIAFAAAFHLHWALGGRLGYAVSLPQRPDGEPVMVHRIGWWRLAAGCIALG